MLNSFQHGFQAVIYSCNHMTNVNILQIHQNISYRIILGNHMSIIWYELLYHCGSKSRQCECPEAHNTLTQEDNFLFAYL